MLRCQSYFKYLDSLTPTNLILPYGGFFGQDNIKMPFRYHGESFRCIILQEVFSMLPGDTDRRV